MALTQTATTLDGREQRQSLINYPLMLGGMAIITAVFLGVRLYQQAFAPMNKPEGTLVGKQPPANPAPARPLDAYVGEYANPYWGPAKISQANGALQLSIGPRGDSFPLTHWDGDTFTFTLQDENAAPGTISTATFGSNTLTLEYFDQDKLGQFTR